MLEGTSRTEVLDVKEYGAKVVIRPLSDGELSKVFAAIGHIPVGEDGVPNVSSIDVSKNLEALRLATSMGMVDPAMSPDDVSKMKFGVPEYIGTRVLELSGVSFSEEDLRKKG